MITFTSGLLVLSACVSVNQQHNESRAFVPEDGKTWLAGDHHIHGKYSARWNWKTQPPSPLLFGDAHYFTALNAKMAAFHQLDWMVTTDHGGPTGGTALEAGRCYKVTVVNNAFRRASVIVGWEQ